MSTPADIVVCEDVWGEPFERLAGTFAVVHDPRLWSDRDRLKTALASARALVVRNRTQVDADLLDAAPNLRLVARAGVGLDNIDLDAADARGVLVLAPLNANARSVAELTIGLALGLARGIPAHDRAVRAGTWDRTPGTELFGRTWGLLGAGATGRATAALAQAFGMPVVAHDPFVDRVAVDARITLTGLEELFGESDVLSVHLPSTADTKGLVDERLLGLMRPGSLLISVGRGEVVDEAALAAALDAGRPAGAALDVRAEEPPRPGPLDDRDDVILTPHVAGITRESQRRILDLLATDIRSVLTGGPARIAVGAVRQSA